MFVDKAVWTPVLVGLSEEMDDDNFKSEIARRQGPEGANYERARHDVWSVMYQLQDTFQSVMGTGSGDTLFLVIEIAWYRAGAETFRGHRTTGGTGFVDGRVGPDLFRWQRTLSLNRLKAAETRSPPSSA